MAVVYQSFKCAKCEVFKFSIQKYCKEPQCIYSREPICEQCIHSFMSVPREEVKGTPTCTDCSRYIDSDRIYHYSDSWQPICNFCVSIKTNKCKGCRFAPKYEQSNGNKILNDPMFGVFVSLIIVVVFFIALFT